MNLLSVTAACLTLLVCCDLACTTWAEVATIKASGDLACVRETCEAQAKSIREQLELQIGAMLQQGAAGMGQGGEQEEPPGMQVLPLPMPVIPGPLNPEKSAE